MTLSDREMAVWKTRGGVVMDLKEMDDEHLLNAFNMTVRQINKATVAQHNKTNMFDTGELDDFDVPDIFCRLQEEMSRRGMW